MDQPNKPVGGTQDARPQDADITKISRANNLRKQVKQRMKALQESEDCQESYDFLHRFKKVFADHLKIMLDMKDENRWDKNDEMGQFYPCIQGHFECALQVAMHLDDGFKDVPGYKPLCHLVDLDTGVDKRDANPFSDVHIRKTDRDLIAYPRDMRAAELVTSEMAWLLLKIEPTVPKSCSAESLAELWDGTNNLDRRIARLEAQLKDGFRLFDRFMDHIFEGFLRQDGYNIRITVAAVTIWRDMNKPLLHVKNAREKLEAATEPDEKHAAKGELDVANTALMEAKDQILTMFRDKPDILRFTGLNIIAARAEDIPTLLAALGLT